MTFSLVTNREASNHVTYAQPASYMGRASAGLYCEWYLSVLSSSTGPVAAPGPYMDWCVPLNSIFQDTMRHVRQANSLKPLSTDWREEVWTRNSGHAPHSKVGTENPCP